MRASPGASTIGSVHTPLASQVTDAAVAAPDPSTSDSGAVRNAPAATFQCDCGTTPALSPAAMTTVVSALKSTPIGSRGGSGATGTIWIPFTGARRTPDTGVVVAARSVKPVASMVKRT